MRAVSPTATVMAGIAPTACGPRFSGGLGVTGPESAWPQAARAAATDATRTRTRRDREGDSMQGKGLSLLELM